jgi:hypothetical protein
MGAATIANYPDKPTVGYAELWSADPFVIVANDWWPHASLRSEDKGDERGIGARYKCDAPAPCWVIWEGTSDGRRVLQIQRAESLDNSPGVNFLPVEPGVNVILFDGEPEPEPPTPEPEEPEEPGEPEPEPPAELPYPQIITIYAGGLGQQTTPIVHWRRLGEKGTPSEFWELIMVIRGDHYNELWKGLEQQLMEALHGG